MKTNILINAANLHGGGAVAVASSFINELTALISESDNIALVVSSEVDSNLKQKKTPLDSFKSYKVIDVYGIKSIWSGINKEFNKYDVIFTVFGPAYFVFSSKRHIFGFAQPWIVYPNNPISAELSFLQRIKQKCKYYIQSLFFSRADSLIVELEHVKKGLENYSYLKGIPTHIVNSTVDSIYSRSEKWQSVEFPKSSADCKLGIIARNYPHKNLSCLLDLKHILLSEYSLNVDFFVTFSQEEWLSCSDEYQKEIKNVGLLRLDQCPSFYDQIDGVVFPSLLECFSATPLETMVMKKPLFSSNLSFIRDCSKDYAHYFDPLDINDMARVISNYYLSHTDDTEALEQAKKYVNSFSSASGRAKDYLSIITTS